MGESVDSVLAGSVGRASNIVQENNSFLEEDVEALTEFQDSVQEIDLGSNGGSGNVMLNGSRPVSDTEKVIDLYDELLFSRQSTQETVEDNAENFDLSMPAAHFLQEVFNTAKFNRKDAVSNIRYLDSRNGMTPQHVKEVVSMTEIVKGYRKKVMEDLEVYDASLENYGRELDSLEEKILELNEDYTLPMDIEEAVNVVEQLENVEERLDQLEDRRRHEMRRMPEITSEYAVLTVNTYLEDEEFDDPVIYDIEELRENIYEAKENIQIA
jgi:hypothetical protein